MDKLRVKHAADVESALTREFGDATVYALADVRREIARIVKRVEAGEREIDSPYLDVTVIVG